MFARALVCICCVKVGTFEWSVLSLGWIEDGGGIFRLCCVSLSSVFLRKFLRCSVCCIRAELGRVCVRGGLRLVWKNRSRERGCFLECRA